MSDYEAGIVAAAKAMFAVTEVDSVDLRWAREIVDAFLAEVDAYTIEAGDGSLPFPKDGIGMFVTHGVLVPLRPKGDTDDE